MTVMDDLSSLSDQQLTELAEMTSAMASPVGMARYCWGERFAVRAHTEALSQAFVDLSERRYDRLIICTPPQVGKSWVSCVWGPFWWLVNRPADRVAVASYGSNLAISRGRAVRKLVNDYGQTFGMRMAPDSRAVNDWHLNTEGGLRAVGIGGSLTGHPVDGVMVIDDPHKDRHEANSKAMRGRVHNWYSSTAVTRLAPGTPVIIVQTLWHPDDLASRRIREDGTIEEGGRWKVVKLPAFATEGDPLGRQVGEPLTHPRLPNSDVYGDIPEREQLIIYWNGKKDESGSDWGPMFQCDPQPTEGALLSREMIKDRTVYRLADIPPAVRSAVAVDPSGGGRSTAGIIGGHTDADGALWWTHDRTAVMPSDGWARAACELAVEIDADSIVIENNFGGDQPEVLVRLTWQALGLEWERENPGADPDDNPYGGMHPYLKSVNSRKGKVIRAEPVAGFVKLWKIRFGPGLGELGEEWATWQPGNPDSPGRIDASVHLAYALVKALPQGMVVATAANASKTPGPPAPGAAPIGGARIRRPPAGGGGYGRR